MRRADPPVRFDDSVMTLVGLAADADGPVADAVFGNLFDLVALNKPAARGHARGEILHALQSMQDKVTPVARRRVASHIARLPVVLPADLAILLGTMTAHMDRSWLQAAQLSQSAWARLIPVLSMDEVRKVACRNDLPPAIALQLAGIRPLPLLLPPPENWQAQPQIDDFEPPVLPSSIAANDFGPLPDVAAVSLQDLGADQVKNLLERIAWFRKQPAPTPKIAAETSDAAPLVETDDEADFALATTSDDLFLLDNPLTDVPRKEPEQVVATSSAASGPDEDILSLPMLLADWFWETDRQGRFVMAAASSAHTAISADAFAALRGQYLLDWVANSPDVKRAEKSLGRRSSLHGLALDIPDGSFAGHWTLSGVAAFDLKSGSYVGHRGVAQRRPIQSANMAYVIPEALALAAHETRTPLNAIMGFAQMIESQPFGSVSPAYAAQAEAILDASTRLLRVLDDVSETSRLDRGLAALPDFGFSLDSMLEAIVAQLNHIAVRRSVNFQLRMASGLPSLWSDKDLVERCINRLAVALLAVAGSGETIGISTRDGMRDHLLISFSRPLALQGVSSAELMKPVRNDETNGPQLNIGFGLRLVQRLAAAVGGHLFTDGPNIDLLLPAVPALAPLQDAAAQ